MADAKLSDSLATLADRLGVSRARVHELIGIIAAAGVTLPPWARARARKERRALGWTKRKVAAA